MSIDQFKSVDITLSNINEDFIPQQNAVQGERSGRSLTVQLTNAGKVEPQSGVSLNLGWSHDSAKNSDGATLQGLDSFKVVDGDKGIFRFDYPSNMMVPGRVTATIQIIGLSSETRSKPFKIKIDPSPFDEEAATSDNSFSALQEALIKAENKDGGAFDTLQSLAELNSKYPKGEKGYAVVLESDGETGYMYTWTGGTWKKGALFQARGIADGAVGVKEVNFLGSNSLATIHWELGTFDKNETTGGVTEIASNLRIKSLFFLLPKGTILRTTDPNIEIALSEYNHSYKMLRNSGFARERQVEGNDVIVRLVARKSDNSVITAGEINTIANRIYMLGLPTNSQSRGQSQIEPVWYFNGAYPELDSTKGKLIFKVEDSNGLDMGIYANGQLIPITNSQREIDLNPVGVTSGNRAVIINLVYKNIMVVPWNELASKSDALILATVRKSGNKYSLNMNCPFKVDGKLNGEISSTLSNNSGLTIIPAAVNSGDSGMPNLDLEKQELQFEWNSTMSFGSETFSTSMLKVPISLSGGSTAFKIYRNMVDGTYETLKYNEKPKDTNNSILICSGRNDTGEISAPFETLLNGAPRYQLSALDDAREVTVSNNTKQYGIKLDAYSTATINFEAMSDDKSATPLTISVYCGKQRQYYFGCDLLNYKVHTLRVITAYKAESVYIKFTGNGKVRNVQIKQEMVAAKKSNVKYIGHRGLGAGIHFPENTMHSFEYARRVGLNMVETDLAVTKDHHIVLLHDADIDRVSDGKGAIKDLTFKEVYEFDFGVKTHERFKGTKIVTLWDFLQWCYASNVHPLLELKEGRINATNAQSLIDMIVACNMYGKVDFISFQMADLKAVATIDNQVGRFAHIGVPTQSLIDELKSIAPQVYYNIYGPTAELVPSQNLCNSNGIKTVASLNYAPDIRDMTRLGLSGNTVDILNLEGCYF